MSRGRGKRSTQEVSVIQDSDASPKRDRMVREMHYSKYRVRSTSRPPAPPVRVPERQFDPAPKVLQRYDIGQRLYPKQGTGILPPNWAPSMGYPSTPSTLGSVRGKPEGGTGTEIPQSQKARYEKRGYVIPGNEENEEEFEGKEEEEREIEREEEEESALPESVLRDSDRVNHEDDTNKSAEDGDDEGEEEEESQEVSSDADRGGGAGREGGAGVNASKDDVVWIDGAPYLDIVSSSSSQFRGELSVCPYCTAL